MAIQIQSRNGSASLWASTNPILAIGEIGLELDTRLMKVGTGLDSWSTLKYQNASTASFCLSASYISASNIDGALVSSSYSKSSSYAPVEPVFSQSISSVKQNALITGATYGITSSWSNSSSISIQSNFSTQSVSSSFSTTASFASNVPLTASFAVSSSNAISASFVSSVLSASFSTTSSHAFTALQSISSSFSSQSISASYAPTVPTVSSSYASTASFAYNAISASFVSGSDVVGAIPSASYSFSASYAPGNPSVSSSYASTSSYSAVAETANNLSTQFVDAISGSVDFTTTLATAVTTSLSFSMAPNEIWRFEAYLGAQCSANTGIKYCISSSTQVKFLEIWVMGSTNAITATTRQRLTATNILQTTAMHTIATTPADDRIWGYVINYTGSCVISIGVASAAAGATTTLFRGGHIVANKIGLNV